MAEDPGKKKVSELVNAIHQGEYVIPHFQRGYEWQPSMVSDLFESIIQDYYAGLLLFWRLDNQRAHREVWDPVWGAPEGNTPSLAILDGQQRLASLYYAIHNPQEEFPNRKTYYRWFLNLDECLNEEYEEAVYYRYSFHHHPTEELRERKDEWIEKGVMPLAILSRSAYLSSQEFEDWLTRYVQERHRRGIIPESISAIKVSNLLQRIRNYEFITTALRSDRDIHDICNIFARINQKGMRLSTFDLMNAFLYPHGIKLRTELWEGLQNHQLKEIDSSMNEYLLKLISLHVQAYCSSKYIYNLIPGAETKKRTPSGEMREVELVHDKVHFDSLWDQACKYAEAARDIMMNVGSFDFGAIKSKFIPNTTIIPVLGAVLWERAQGKETTGFSETCQKWYWSAVFSGDYSGSSDTVMAQDFRDWRAWLEEGREIGRVSRVDADFVENELGLRNTARGAQYNAVLCLLALNGAKDFDTRRPLASGDYIGEKINDHHIFPRGVEDLEDDKSTEFAECKDSILNRTLLLDKTNKHLIRNKRPSIYLTELMEKNPEVTRVQLEELLTAHFISPQALDCLMDDDFGGFIAERERTLKEHILTLVEA